MSERKKIAPVLKVELVEKYLRDEIGIREAARQGIRFLGKVNLSTQT